MRRDWGGLSPLTFCICMTGALFLTQSCSYGEEALSEKEQAAKREIAALVLQINQPKEYSYREIALEKLFELKAKCSHPGIRYSLDYLIGNVLWNSPDSVRIYQPYERLKMLVAQMAKDYPEFVNDQRTISLELKLHECATAKEYKKEKEWLTNFLTVRMGQCAKWYPSAAIAFLNCSQDDCAILAAEALVELEVREKPGISTEDAMNVVLENVKALKLEKILESAINDGAAEIVKRVNSKRHAKSIRDVELDTTQVAAAAGDKSTISSEERLKEIRSKLQNVGDHEKDVQKYLLWVSSDGLRLTSYSADTSTMESDLAAEIFGAVAGHAHVADDDIEGWLKVASILTKVKAADSVIWMAENAVVQATKKKAQQPEPK